MAFRASTALFIVLALMAACAPGEENLAVVANAPGTFEAGQPQRLLVGLVDPVTSAYLASPELAASAELTAPDGTESEVPATFMWTVPDVRGLYRIDHTFDQEGEWWVQLQPTGLGPTPRSAFAVVDSASLPGPGEPAIAVVTRTAADHSLADISSDDEPDPAFYQTSLDAALENGLPTVVVFATPAFCASQTCGPMLDQVKAASREHPDANYIHVEIYENLDAASTSELVVDPAVTAWGLPSEPWVFVVDANGIVASRFEGAMSSDELEAALEAVGA
jgi:hypothetical protein